MIVLEPVGMFHAVSAFAAIVQSDDHDDAPGECKAANLSDYLIWSGA